MKIFTENGEKTWKICTLGWTYTQAFIHIYISFSLIVTSIIIDTQ